jgi:hypothetical protein
MSQRSGPTAAHIKLGHHLVDSLPIQGQSPWVLVLLARHGHCNSQSFPRKRESTPQISGNVLPTDWVPTFAGMTGVWKGIPSELTILPPPFKGLVNSVYFGGGRLILHEGIVTGMLHYLESGSPNGRHARLVGASRRAGACPYNGCRIVLFLPHLCRTSLGSICSDQAAANLRIGNEIVYGGPSWPVASVQPRPMDNWTRLSSSVPEKCCGDSDQQGLRSSATLGLSRLNRQHVV